MPLALKRAFRFFPALVLVVVGMCAVLVPQAHAAISFVQATGTGAQAFTSGPGTSTKAFGSDTTAGDLIIVNLISQNAPTFPTGTLSDTQGDTFVLATSTNIVNGTTSVYLYYAANIHGGPNTVNFRWTSVPWVYNMSISEYAGVATTSPLDQIASKFANTPTSLNTGSTTITQANELLFSTFDDQVCVATTSPPSVSSGWSLRLDDQKADPYLFTADRVVNAIGTYSNTWTPSDLSCSGLAYIATFEAPAEGGGGGNGTPPPTKFWFSGIFNFIGNFLFL